MKSSLMIYLADEYDDASNNYRMCWNNLRISHNVFSFFPPVSQSGLAGDVCPDPGVPEYGKRMGSTFQ